jgi:hypothetical protein
MQHLVKFQWFSPCTITTTLQLDRYFPISLWDFQGVDWELLELSVQMVAETVISAPQ